MTERQVNGEHVLEQLLVTYQGSTLGDYLTNQIGDNRPFRSRRELAMSAGLNQNVVGLIIDNITHRAEPETLNKLAEALDVPKVFLHIMAGYLTPEDVFGVLEYQRTAPPQNDIYASLSKLRPEMRKVLEDLIHTFARHYGVNKSET